jgi:hypothetical protein
MAVLLGGALGSATAMLIVGYLVFRLGPKKLIVNFAIQLLVTILITMYLATDHYGTHVSAVDAEADWLGWIIGNAVMGFISVKKRRDMPVPPVGPLP